MAISILLVDDHTIFRKGVRALLETSPGFTVTGEADGGAEALALAVELRPDVLVLDWVMPGVSGLDVLRQVRRDMPDIRVIILSMHADESYVSSAVQNGASGYVLKDDIVPHLVKAVRSAAAGMTAYGPYLSPSLAGPNPPLSQRIQFYPGP